MVSVAKLSFAISLMVAAFAATFFGPEVQPENSQGTVSANEESFVLQDSNPDELGRVKWRRGLKEAKIDSKKTGKPIFLLFQEVPG